MLLSQVKDAALANYNHFQLLVKNHKLYFSKDNDKHVFGTKLYPIGKRNVSLFMDSVTEKGAFEEVSTYLETSGWQPRNGYCYSNSELLQNAFKTHGIDAKYYSGWLFVGHQYPIHHAWVVVDDNVYDIGINVLSQSKMFEQIESGLNPYSEACVKEIKALESKPFPIQDFFVWGKVPKELFYIGAEDTPNGARLKYNACMKVVAEHPSYKGMQKVSGSTQHFRTKYQQALENS